MVISAELVIGDNGVISNEDYGNLFGSIKVKVTGDFDEREVPVTVENSEDFKNLTVSKNTDTCKTYVEEDGITYISGTKDCIDFNYVWYSGKLWRITAIYPDGSMKMITEDNITSIAFGSNYTFYSSSSTNSWIYQWLNQDFLDTLYNYENIIKTDSTWNVTSGDGTISTKLAETTMVPAKVGLLNSYEYYMAYKNASASTNYLNIGYYWWLSNRYSTSSSNVWCVHTGGGVSSSNGSDVTPSGSMRGVRPVVILNSDIMISGGIGLKSDPYRIKGDKEDAEPNITLLNTRSSGEYVNFDEDLYRIVEIENNTTKINKADYVRNESGAVLTKYLSSNNNVNYSSGSTDEYWVYYLNNTWYNNIATEYKNMLENGTYYLGKVNSDITYNYKKAICSAVSNTLTTKECQKTTKIRTVYVGLPRYGEMFASQLAAQFATPEKP